MNQYSFLSRLLHDPALTIEFLPKQTSKDCLMSNALINKEQEIDRPVDFDHQNLLVVKKVSGISNNRKSKISRVTQRNVILDDIKPIKPNVFEAKVVKKKIRSTADGIDKSNTINEVVQRINVLTKKLTRSRKLEKSKQEINVNKKCKLKKSDAQNTDAIHCDVCNKIFKSNLDIGLHSKQHSKDNKFSCHICSKFSTVSDYRLKMHIRIHEGNCPFKCEICEKPFTRAVTAKEHVNFHTGEKPFVCEICGKAFMFSRFLSSHRSYQHSNVVTDTPLVTYDCTICDIRYSIASSLRKHNLRKHRNENMQFVLCDICGKKLSSKEHFKFHSRIHTGFKPHACSFCSKAFTRKEYLKEHENIHTGEKPYTCQFCNKGFTQRTPLRVHMRTHTGERPYVCICCGKGFTSKGAVDNHMKLCNGVRK